MNEIDDIARLALFVVAAISGIAVGAAILYISYVAFIEPYLLII